LSPNPKPGASDTSSFPLVGIGSFKNSSPKQGNTDCPSGLLLMYSPGAHVIICNVYGWDEVLTKGSMRLRHQVVVRVRAGSMRTLRKWLVLCLVKATDPTDNRDVVSSGLCGDSEEFGQTSQPHHVRLCAREFVTSCATSTDQPAECRPNDPQSAYGIRSVSTRVRQSST
jgi:hypothetical protein